MIFDSSTSRHYFAVNPGMKSRVDKDPYEAFLKQLLPQASITPGVVAPTLDQDLPILVKRAEWYHHLGEYCGDQRTWKMLLQMVGLPKSNSSRISKMDGGMEKTLWKLHDVSERYMERIRQDAHEANRMTLRNLMQYPA